MKMMKYMTSIATALFALVACSDADDILSAYHNDPDAVHITAEVGKASADGFTRSNPLGTPDKQKKFNNYVIIIIFKRNMKLQKNGIMGILLAIKMFIILGVL